ncbi:MAG: hypothetical protein ACC644_05535 [Candidatus Hydrothermarchaeales archaeon]
MTTWKMDTVTLLKRDGTFRKAKSYKAKDGAFSVAKVADKNWAVILHGPGVAFPHRYQTKAAAQEAACALIEAGRVAWDAPDIPTLLESVGGLDILKQHADQFLGNDY